MIVRLCTGAEHFRHEIDQRVFIPTGWLPGSWFRVEISVNSSLLRHRCSSHDLLVKPVKYACRTTRSTCPLPVSWCFVTCQITLDFVSSSLPHLVAYLSSIILFLEGCTANILILLRSSFAEVNHGRIKRRHVTNMRLHSRSCSVGSCTILGSWQ